MQLHPLVGATTTRCCSTSASRTPSCPFALWLFILVDTSMLDNHHDSSGKENDQKGKNDRQRGRHLKAIDGKFERTAINAIVMIVRLFTAVCLFVWLNGWGKWIRQRTEWVSLYLKDNGERCGALTEGRPSPPYTHKSSFAYCRILRDDSLHLFYMHQYPVMTTPTSTQNFDLAVITCCISSTIRRHTFAMGWRGMFSVSLMYRHLCAAMNLWDG